MNFGAASTDADLLFAVEQRHRGDRDPTSSRRWAGYLQRPEVGVVGAKLLYYDGLVQHAGMLIGPDGTVVHVEPERGPMRKAAILAGRCAPAISQRVTARARW